MSSIKEQVLAQQQGQYSESDDKYLSVLKQYNCDLNDEEVAAEVKKILDEKVAENETMEVKKFLFGSIELTSLHTEDTEEGSGCYRVRPLQGRDRSHHREAEEEGVRVRHRRASQGHHPGEDG